MEKVYSKEDLKEMELLRDFGDYHSDLRDVLIKTYAIDIEKTTLEIMNILIERKLPVVVVDKIVSNVCLALKVSISAVTSAVTLESLN